MKLNFGNCRGGSLLEHLPNHRHQTFDIHLIRANPGLRNIFFSKFRSCIRRLIPQPPTAARASAASGVLK